MMGLVPGKIKTLLNKVLGNRGKSICGKKDVTTVFKSLPRTTDFM